MEKRYAEEIATFAKGLSFRDIPKQIVQEAKHRTLDLIGVALPAWKEPPAKMMVDFVKKLRGTKESTIFTYGDKVPAPNAALSNGVMGHCLELDDDHNWMIGHPGVTAVPACLAAAEKERVDGKTYITALVLDYDVACRTGMAVKPGVLHGKGYHPTGVCGTFGSAIGAGKILDLNESQIAAALGIAGSQASSLFEFVADGSWAKRFNAGWAAHNGIIAASLAKRGYTGPHTIFEGLHGFYRAFAGDGNYDLSILMRNLGKQFEIARTSYKPYACCRYCHPPIDAALGVMHEYDIKPDEIKEVKVKIFTEALHIVAEPSERKYKPLTTVDAQFSVYYSVAVAMLYGRALIDEFSVQKLKDPSVLELASRITCEVDPEMDKVYPRLYPASVTIRTKDSREYFYKVKTAKGDPEWPLTEEEVKEKFQILSSHVIDEDHIKEIIRTVNRLDRLTDMSELTKLLHKC